MKEIGKITHFYDKIGVAIVKLSKPLKVGDEIEIKGKTTDLKQTIDSIQFEHQNIEAGKSGQEAGLKVHAKAREGDAVFNGSEA